MTRILFNLTVLLGICCTLSHVLTPLPFCIVPGGRCRLGQCCPGSKCVDVPGSRTGICESDSCLLSGKSCAPNGKPCCPNLTCQAVVTGAFPRVDIFENGTVSDSILDRVCFNQNCGSGDCTKIPCCPGTFCGTFRNVSSCISPV